MHCSAVWLHSKLKKIKVKKNGDESIVLGKLNPFSGVAEASIHLSYLSFFSFSTLSFISHENYFILLTLVISIRFHNANLLIRLKARKQRVTVSFTWWEQWFMTRGESSSTRIIFKTLQGWQGNMKLNDVQKTKILIIHKWKFKTIMTLMIICCLMSYAVELTLMSLKHMTMKTAICDQIRSRLDVKLFLRQHFTWSLWCIWNAGSCEWYTNIWHQQTDEWTFT